MDVYFMFFGHFLQSIRAFVARLRSAGIRFQVSETSDQWSVVSDQGRGNRGTSE
jgi:uncharacterized protein with von Willebrand factor type A (vWA) domain